MKHVKVVVIGLDLGKQHVRSYQYIDGIVIMVICDVDPARLEGVGNRYGGERRETDFCCLIADPDMDVISICFCDNFHLEQVVSDCPHEKHVTIENPIALYRQDAEVMPKQLKL